MTPFLQNNDIEIYSTHNEGKSVIATSVLKNVYMNKLDDVVNKCNNTNI